jgi:poly-gamma-glutamate capsule biosynthesis protein CapA/YwtB (metallophosphatase superfamily)
LTTSFQLSAFSRQLALAAILGPLLASCANGDEAGQRPAYVCPEPCPAFEIVWVGDILLGDAAQPFLDAEGYAWPFEHVGAVLQGDFAIGNAEGPITELTEAFYPSQRWSYNAQPPSAPALAGAGFDAIGLANNHTFDRGPQGLRDTLDHLHDAGLRTFGAGYTLDDARRPLLIETPYGKVAVVAFAEDWSFARLAGPSSPGLLPSTEPALRAAHDGAMEAGASWVVAYVHWGENYSGVDAGQRQMAELLAAAGYDLVVGHHPHVAQPIEVVEGVPVLYSLGNFVFGTPGRFSAEHPGYGLVARTYLGPDGFEGVEVTCILTDNDRVRFQPRLCPSDEAEALLTPFGFAWSQGRASVSFASD